MTLAMFSITHIATYRWIWLLGKSNSKTQIKAKGKLGIPFIELVKDRIHLNNIFPSAFKMFPLIINFYTITWEHVHWVK